MAPGQQCLSADWVGSEGVQRRGAVAEAAVIGVASAKWSERPLLIVVRRPGHEVSAPELLDFFRGKVAKFCQPDAVEFVEQLPHTATGKLLKTQLRKDFAGYEVP